MNIKTNILLRIYFVAFICLLFGAAVLGKVYYVQNYKGDYWKAMADSLSTQIFEVPAERGNIYSFDDKLLATSVPYFELHIDFGSKAMTDDVFQKSVDSLAFYMWKSFALQTVDSYKRDLVKARKQRKRYFPLCKNADYALLEQIKTWPLFREGKFKGGLIIETRQSRKNPYGYLAQRTIGYTRDNAPDIGLESAFNKFLSGVNGKILKQKISGGEWMPLKTAGQIESQDGYDIITTIDLGLQDIAESALNSALQEYRADFGCAILMEVQTGAIKAIANLGKTADSSYSENYNYALGLSNEPGSVFKVASYLALFDDGYITLADSINTDHASAVFAGQVLTDDGHNTQYTFVHPDLALAISSNVAVAKWVTKYYSGNKNKYYQKLAQFGLTDKTHIELEGEPQPFIQTPDKWSALSLPWMAHGYEVKFTPLQILTFYNAIANKGNRMKPYLVQKIVDNGTVIKEFKPETTKNKICSDKAVEYAKQIMLAVVESEHGTGRKIFSPHYRIAGKTGTAKMSFGSEGYSNKNLSSFVGFFPADDPIYSCIVVIGGPQGFLTTGGAVSAPIFKVIADKIITSNIDRNKPFNKDSSIVNQYPPLIVGETQQVKNIAELFHFKPNIKESWDYTAAKMVPHKTIVAPVEVKAAQIPNVKGMLLDDAIYLLENAGLKVQFIGKGKVQTQSLPAGSTAGKGMVIYLQLG